MKTVQRLVLIALSAFAIGPAAAQAPRQLVNDAVQALGGEQALERLNTITLRGQNTRYEVESSFEPGPKAELRPGSEAKFLVSRDLASGTARTDWERRIVRVPKPFIQKYSEITNGGIGYVSGIDSANRTEASKKNNPTGHAMSGARAAAVLRELTRQSPRLLLDMKKNPQAVSALPPQSVDGKTLPAARYDVRDWSYIVMFDPQTKLPARIRTRDGDRIQGDSNYDLVLGDWRDVGGVKIAHAISYELNGRQLEKTTIEQASANPSLNASLFEIPIAARAVAVRAAMGNVPYQWVMRRHAWGNLMDSDTIGWDASARAEPDLVDIAPGISLSQGVSHNSMVVEMDRYLVVFDAPIDEQFSEWMIGASKKRYPNKPIRYLILTHHHWDHSSGARTYVAEGATVVVGKGAKEHFARMFKAPGTILNDRLQR
jgi:hypothetical protein